MNENTQETLTADEMIALETIAMKSYNLGWNEAIETLIEAFALMDKRIQIRDLRSVLPIMLRKDSDEATS